MTDRLNYASAGAQRKRATADLTFGEAIVTRFGDCWRVQWMPHGNCTIGTQRFSSIGEARFWCAQRRIAIVDVVL